MVSDSSIIVEKVKRAVRMVLRNDLFLLRITAHELAIAHKLAEYLQHEFPDFHVDFDYNKREEQPKTLNDADVRPDIIVHIRDTKCNLLIVEIKKSDDPPSEIEEAIGRVNDFISNEDFKYAFGLVIVFNVGEDYQKKPILKWYPT